MPEKYQSEAIFQKSHQLECKVPPKALGEVHQFELTTAKDVANFAAPYDRQKVFEPVRLRSSTGSFDSKYSSIGRFRFNHIDKPQGMDPGDTPSRVQCEVPRLSSQHLSEDRVYESPDDDDVVDGKRASVQIETILVLKLIFIGHVSQVSATNSDGDKAVSAQEPPNTHSESTLKRKRENADELVEQVTTPDPFSTVGPIKDDYEIMGPSLQTDLFTQLSSHDSEGFLKKPENTYNKYPSTLNSLSGSEFLRIAQILIDQITFHSHNLFTISKSLSGLLPAASPISLDLKEPLLHSSISQTLPGALRCELKQLSTIGESSNPSSSRESQVTQRNNNNNNNKRSSLPWRGNAQEEDSDRIFAINAPLVAVRRANTPVDLSASALVFWEELSLGPASPEKDVDFICICPATPFLEDRLDEFLDTVQSAYYACELGTYTPYLAGGHPDGICRINTDSMKSFDELMNAVDDACESIGGCLTKVSK